MAAELFNIGMADFSSLMNNTNTLVNNIGFFQSSNNFCTLILKLLIFMNLRPVECKTLPEFVKNTTEKISKKLEDDITKFEKANQTTGSDWKAIAQDLIHTGIVKGALYYQKTNHKNGRKWIVFLISVLANYHFFSFYKQALIGAIFSLPGASFLAEAEPRWAEFMYAYMVFCIAVICLSKFFWCFRALIKFQYVIVLPIGLGCILADDFGCEVFEYSLNLALHTHRKVELCQKYPETSLSILLTLLILALFLGIEIVKHTRKSSKSRSCSAQNEPPIRTNTEIINIHPDRDPIQNQDP